MAIDRELVLHVASLANLELSDTEVVYYETQLSRILDYVAQLESMPDELGEAWLPDTQAPATPERPDVSQPSLLPELALANAPETDGTAFRVPRIIE